MKRISLFAILILMGIILWRCDQERVEPLSSEMVEELTLLPSTSTGIGYINIVSLRESPFFSMLKERWENRHFHSDEYQEFMKATGLDLRKDINEIYLGLVTNKMKDEPSVLMLIHGNFNQDKIMDYISQQDEDHNIEKETIEDFVLYVINKDEVAFSFVSDKRVVLGNASLMRDWLEKYKQRQKTQIQPELLRCIQQLKYKSGVWFIFNAEEVIQKMMEEIEKHPEGSRFSGLKNIRDVNFSMRANDQLRFSGLGNFSDSENAELFRDAVKGFIATMKLSMSEDRGAVDVLNKITVKVRNNQVLMDFEMNQEDIEKLKKHKPKIAFL